MSDAELSFEDMRVPKRYLLGEENMGFMYLMQNFQSERIIACTSALSGGQLMMDDAIAYGRDRKAFGERSHQGAPMRSRAPARTKSR